MKSLAKQILRYPHKLGWFLGYNDLNEIHSRWIKRIWGQDKSRTLWAHRGSFKTTSIVVVGAIWYALFNPDDPILICRKTHTNACNILATISKHYKGAEMKALYGELYDINDFRLIMDRRDRIVLPTKTSKTEEGSMDAAGTDSSVTGTHYPRIHTDDIITIKDRISKAERLRTLAFIMELKNVLNPGGAQTNTGTPWHRDDGYQFLPPAEKFPIGSTGIQRFTPEHVAELKREMTHSLFSANYELNHISDEEREFDDPVWGDWPADLQWAKAYLDPAYSGDHHTALTMIGYKNGQHYARGWVWRMHVTKLYRKIASLMRQFKGGTLYVETNADKGMSADGLRKVWPSVRERHESINKHIKILTYAAAFFCQLIWAHDTQPEYMAQVLDYKEGEEPDDAPDSLAGMIRELKLGKKSLLDRFK